MTVDVDGETAALRRARSVGILTVLGWLGPAAALLVYQVVQRL